MCFVNRVNNRIKGGVKGTECVGDRVGRKVGGGVLIMQGWHEGLGVREPMVFVYTFVSSSIRVEPCSL